MFFVTNEIRFPRRSAVARVTIWDQKNSKKAKIFHKIVSRFLIVFRLKKYKKISAENLMMHTYVQILMRPYKAFCSIISASMYAVK